FTSPIASARLGLFNPATGKPEDGPLGFESPDATETYMVFDVSTPIPELLATASGRIEIFDDLGTGTAYGGQEVSAAHNGRLFGVDPNAAAVADILAHQGGRFAVGGAITPLARGDERELGFGGGGGNTPRQLALTLADSDYYAISAD